MIFWSRRKNDILFRVISALIPGHHRRAREPDKQASVCDDLRQDLGLSRESFAPCSSRKLRKLAVYRSQHVISVSRMDLGNEAMAC